MLPGCHCRSHTGPLKIAGNAPPTVTITDPVTNQSMGMFSSMQITYVDNDPDDVATTDIIMIEVATNGERAISTGVAEANGTPHTVTWDTDSGAPWNAGTYRVEARTTDGHHPLVKHKSPAILTLGSTSTFTSAKFDSEGAILKSDAVATSASGSIAVAGAFSKTPASSTLTLGKGQPTQSTLTIDGAAAGEGVVARYKSDGTLLWARQTSTAMGAAASTTEISAVAVLDDESVVCAGSFTSTSVGGKVVISAGQTDAFTLNYPATPGVDERAGFVACYNAAGALVWAHAIVVTNGSADFRPVAMASAGASRGILMSGSCGATTVFNADGAAPVTLQIGNATQVFVARYEADGSLAFVKSSQSAASQNNLGQSLSAFADGSFVITGARGGAMTLGAGESRRKTLSAGTPAFFARYNSDGTLAWAKEFNHQISGTGAIVNYGAAAASADGTIAYVGVYDNQSGRPDSLVIGLSEARETVINSDGGGSTLFIARFNGDGSLIFAKKAGGELQKDQPGARIASLPDGSFVVVGTLNGGKTPPVFGAGELNETALGVPFETGAWVVRYSSDGLLMSVYDTFASVASPDDVPFGVPVVKQNPATSTSVALLSNGDCVLCGGEQVPNANAKASQQFLTRIGQ